MDYNLREEFDLLLNQITNKIEIINEIGIPLFLDDKFNVLNKINSEISNCHKCILADSRNHAVTGEGSMDAILVFVTDFPCEVSDREGKFSAGVTGKLLSKIIEVMGIGKKDVYVTNVLKCFVPKKHILDDDEIKSCKEFLFRELKNIRPVLICAMGDLPVKTILNVNEEIKDIHGKIHSFFDMDVIPTFSLNDCLINNEHKKIVWEDIKGIMRMLNLPFKIQK